VRLKDEKEKGGVSINFLFHLPRFRASTLSLNLPPPNLLNFDIYQHSCVLPIYSIRFFRPTVLSCCNRRQRNHTAITESKRELRQRTLSFRIHPQSCSRYPLGWRYCSLPRLFSILRYLWREMSELHKFLAFLMSSYHTTATIA
jgi:hypothetical protein